MSVVVKLAGKTVSVECGEDFNFKDDEILRRAMLSVKNCFNFDGPYISGVYLITFMGTEDDDVLEKRVAEVMLSYGQGEL